MTKGNSWDIILPFSGNEHDQSYIRESQSIKAYLIDLAERYLRVHTGINIKDLRFNTTLLEGFTTKQGILPNYFVLHPILLLICEVFPTYN